MSPDAYSNVPLALPSEWDLELLRDRQTLAAGEEELIGDDVAAAMAPGDADVASDRLFWFRWITGHQVAFLCWRAAALLLMAEHAPGRHDDHGLERAALWLRTSTTMYVYAASCPREVYHRIIRPTMTLWHAAFSGTWSLDFRPLPGLIADLDDGPWSQDVVRVQRAFREGRQVHAAAARKLVPSGGSILNTFRQSHPAGVPRPETAAFYFDSFFLVRRTRVTQADLVAAARYRAERVLADLNRHGLYVPTADSRHEIPPGDIGASFEECGEALPVLLSRVADYIPASGAA